ncbi:dinitrogenase iron-molybdenum cofactor biosynthesis protein [Desulfobacter hydrogenophilus]|uniref:Dinitrogenase iron-molybdenum cofactor biosynthesis protein n=1 Tax=Desulfobacter hydrogenophilus TaxID=2291 RepID=A0A328FFL6_9BACT|nr:NifB/NifX family molybdenum-iron cluster-binding protein [Desulfobacter hydrogenophilus]NDY72385.1 dinitrogenase iron-molybdenum cofactor biosynthesis protein [Desulfobacter hydrogenophilus]QBH13111.1 dinitrogenase iron-molybdenum cofactor biosynthesis protein [Desulfobacter hydrogenophilus]RAM01817.1 dinitrogenase iron-molybdenum cofactor biosynthesis protein [Desulfobacter hydrogenophilus]
MKVAISAYGQNLDAEINPRFGRCDFLLIVDTDTMAYESFANESMNLGGGAGIQTASFVISKGVQAVLTGSCGPNAMEVFNSAGVDVYPGQAGTAAQAVTRLKNNELTNVTQATAEEKSGMNSGTAPQRPMADPNSRTPGMGSGRGMGGGGRGMGGGGGRGMGGGGGRGMGGGGGGGMGGRR